MDLVGGGEVVAYSEVILWHMPVQKQTCQDGRCPGVH